jgi:hypothetical protein
MFGEVQAARILMAFAAITVMRVVSIGIEIRICVEGLTSVPLFALVVWTFVSKTAV